MRALYEEILTTTNPKAQVFFNQWKILFGEVCGYDVENLSDKLNKLAEFYVVKGQAAARASTLRRSHLLRYFDQTAGGGDCRTFLIPICS